MKTKLTILVEEENIKFAKKFAKDNHTSVSKLMNDFLMDIKTAKKERKITYDPYIQKYAGVFNTGSKNIMEEMFEKKKGRRH